MMNTEPKQTGGPPMNGRPIEEHLQRLCERFNVPEPWRSLTLSRFADGRERYGPWNHLSMSDEELKSETDAEGADLLAFVLFIPWLRTYCSTLVNGKQIDLDDEGAPDEAVDAELVDSIVETLRLLSASRTRTGR